MPKVTAAEDVDLYYEVHGEGPGVALLHGGGNNHFVWWRVTPILARHFRVITPDVRGFGWSICSRTSADPRHHTDDLRAILDATDAGPLTLVCHSMSAIAGLRLAIEEPERVRSLVLCAAPAVRTPGTLEGFARVEAFLDSPDPRAAMTERAFAPGMAERLPAIAFLYDKLNRLNRPFPRGVLLSGLRDTAVPPERLDGFDVPTLVLAGMLDQLLPTNVLADVADAIPGAEFHPLESVGHTPFLEDPDAFLSAVGPWLGVEFEAPTGHRRRRTLG